MAQPLIELLKKDAFQWTRETQEAFEALKVAMITTPVLAIPDFSKTFLIETDACGERIRVVLMQEGHPIAYINKSLSLKNQFNPFMRKRC